ncbi:imidazoleglycerol-phosphate dehydratase [Striga asiatica]|uniref:Imidazoleglycerol-phosphate dehydratase n=1 Tax=Striga asiatica TaxID=4170 RepID=A0A5A7PT67_STRAF|nr:imidazoleglycerol-phosphate dehydratase [Striga asiatica]
MGKDSETPNDRSDTNPSLASKLESGTQQNSLGGKSVDNQADISGDLGHDLVDSVGLEKGSNLGGAVGVEKGNESSPSKHVDLMCLDNLVSFPVQMSTSRLSSDLSPICGKKKTSLKKPVIEDRRKSVGSTKESVFISLVTTLDVGGFLLLKY